MKQRIFISIHYLELGGVETSLIGLLQSFDYNKYEVDLFVYSHRGEMMGFIPKEVNLLPEIKSYAQIERPIISVVKDGFWGIAFSRLKAKMRFRKYARMNHPGESSAALQYIYLSVSPFLPSLDYLGEYDLAISFLAPHNIVLEKVKARKKAAWIHTDYSQIDIDDDVEIQVWREFDHIVSISHDVGNAFVKRFPSLKPKVTEIENILSPIFVCQRAEQIPQNEVMREINGEVGETIILSIGRFTMQKNFDSIPDICRRIIDSGCSVKWYIIGYGEDEALVRNNISVAGMEKYVIILGKKVNPYPYIKACDLYIQPSRYEGKSVAVREAQILCKPVVITDYPTSRCQVKNRVDGVIVPMDNARCAEGIVDLIRNSMLRESIIENLRNSDFSNLRMVSKIDSLLI